MVSIYSCGYLSAPSTQREDTNQIKSSWLLLTALAGDLPNPKLTPGATDPSITQQSIQKTVKFTGNFCDYRYQN